MISGERNFRIHGPPPYRVVLVHGGPGAIGYMAPFASEISSAAGVIEAFQTKKSIEGLLDELKAILLQQASTPVILCGHSWGAWLATVFTSRNPGLVGKLILVASAPFEENYAKDIMEVRMNRLSEGERDRFDELLKMLESNGNMDKNDVFRKIANILRKADAYDPSADQYENSTLDYYLYQTVWHEAEKLRTCGDLLNYTTNIQCPVLAIHGDYDPHPAAGVRRPLERNISDFTFHLLEKCGHEPWTEKQAQTKFFTLLKNELRLE